VVVCTQDAAERKKQRQAERLKRQESDRREERERKRHEKELHVQRALQDALAVALPPRKKARSDAGDTLS
jgi:hypothetical protein